MRFLFMKFYEFIKWLKMRIGYFCECYNSGLWGGNWDLKFQSFDTDFGDSWRHHHFLNTHCGECFCLQLEYIVIYTYVC